MSNHYTFRAIDADGKVYHQGTTTNGRNGHLTARNFSEAMKIAKLLAIAQPESKIEAIKNGSVAYTIEPTENLFGAEVLW